jgi:general secretion pathway protein A
MYSHHFGLTQDPFSIAPDPRYLFMSERHREALAHLLFGVAGPHGAAGGSGGGFVLLTGDIGTGKTTICRCFLEQIPAGCHVAYIFNPKLTVSELLQSICEEFHITVAATASVPPTVKDYIDTLNAFLLQRHAAGHSSVLIIDEAQNLQADVLEQLRLLTNLETNERKLLQIVLIGQPELRAMLGRPELEQLAQRVIARFHLDALTEAESVHYIEHRLAVAGHTGALPFDRSALQRIHRLARGVPRRINLLCGRALLGAWAHGLHRVNRPVVNRAAVEVFGPERQASPGARLTPTTYLIGGLCVLAGAAFAGFAVWTSGQQPHPPVPAPITTATPAPTASTIPPLSLSLPLSAPHGLPAQRPIEPVEPLLPQLPRAINMAWQELAPSWKLQAGEGDPCENATHQQLQCYRTSNLTVPQLRQLGRPGILTLQADKGSPVYAVLVGLTDQTATLQVAAALHTVPLVSLARLWSGDFATYWRAPAGYSPLVRGGSTGPVFQELARQLAQLDGAPARLSSEAMAPVLDAELRARVRDFQHAHGLKPDGQPGPMTFMQIESARGANEPRLLTEPL